MVGEVRQENPSQQRQPKRHGQVGVVGYRAKGHLHAAEVMHKDFSSSCEVRGEMCHQWNS